MKRTAVVWIYSIMLGFGVLSLILGVVGSIVGIFTLEEKILYAGLLLINTIILIVDSLFLYYFFMLKRKAKTWTHIAFGTSLLFIIIGNILQLIQESKIDSISFFYIIAVLIMWWVVYDYIKKKKIDNEFLFSH